MFMLRSEKDSSQIVFDCEITSNSMNANDIEYFIDTTGCKRVYDDFYD